MVIDAVGKIKQRRGIECGNRAAILNRVSEKASLIRCHLSSRYRSKSCICKEKSIPGRKSRICKDPEMEMCLYI